MTGYALAVLVLLGPYFVLAVLGEVKFARMKKVLAKRRHSPTRDKFIDLLQTSCEPDIAELMWDELVDYYKPGMTPHPDDDFVHDLPIDEGERSLWVEEFCERNDLNESDLDPWPSALATTVRNFAEWLSDNRRRLSRAA